MVGWSYAAAYWQILQAGRAIYFLQRRSPLRTAVLVPIAGWFGVGVNTAAARPRRRGGQFIAVAAGLA